MDSYDKVDYSPHADETFNVWVELGALDPKQQHILDHSSVRRFEIKVKSSSPEAEDLIHEPLKVLLEREIPGVTRESRVVSHIRHHERGLRYRIIRAMASVEESTGDVAMEYDKQTWE